MKTLLFLLALACAFPAFGKDIAVYREGTLTITLTDDPCELTDYVVNLKRKARWEDGVKKYNGCYGVRGPIVVLYFDDKTVAIGGVDSLQMVEGI